MSQDPELPPHINARAHRMLKDVATEEVVLAFRSDDIRSILLKGPSVARWLYDNEEIRTYADTDLLISSSDRGRAEEVLARSGFVFGDPPVIPGDRPRHADSWIRERDGAAVDLHRTIIGAQVSPDRVWDVLSRRTERMELRKIEVEVLDVPARCVQLALHVAHHGEDYPQPIEDLQRALAAEGADIWWEAAAVAGEIKALGAFCQGLSFIPQGRRLLENLSLEVPPTVEAALRADGTPGALGLQWLMQERSIRSRALLLLRKALPPPDYIRDWWPPARRNRRSLWLGYLRRIVFLIKQLLPALRSLREARRKSRR